MEERDATDCRGYKNGCKAGCGGSEPVVQVRYFVPQVQVRLTVLLVIRNISGVSRIPLLIFCLHHLFCPRLASIWTVTLALLFVYWLQNKLVLLACQGLLRWMRCMRAPWQAANAQVVPGFHDVVLADQVPSSTPRECACICMHGGGMADISCHTLRVPVSSAA
jgi:hypothetical protein